MRDTSLGLYAVDVCIIVMVTLKHGEQVISPLANVKYQRGNQVKLYGKYLFEIIYYVLL